MRYGIVVCSICFGFGLKLPLLTRLNIIKQLAEDNKKPDKIIIENKKRCTKCGGTGWIFSSQAKQGISDDTIIRWIDR